MVLWWPKNLVNLGVLDTVRRMYGRNEMWHADISWPPPEMIQFWPVLVQFQPSWYHTSQMLMRMYTKFILIMTDISCTSDESIIDLIVVFHNNYFPSSEQPEQRVLAHMLWQPTSICIAIFHKHCCRIWSWSPMPCEKHGPRDSVDKNRGRRPRFLSLLRPEGHVFHTAWETMIKSYYSTLAVWFFPCFIHINMNFSALKWSISGSLCGC